MHYPIESTESVNHSTTLFGFRRDLRLTDNAGLYHTLSKNEHVLPVFIFDTQLLDMLEDKADRRVGFIYQTLIQLKTEQRFCPYSLGHHQHHFKQVEGGVEMTDEVNYAIPLGIIGRVAHWPWLGREVNRIFNHRFMVLEKYFNKNIEPF
jgi:hypothetical protein